LKKRQKESTMVHEGRDADDATPIWKGTELRPGLIDKPSVVQGSPELEPNGFRILFRLT
jgi:hypothetical protein